MLVKLPGPFATEIRLICFQYSLGRIVSIQVNSLLDRDRPIANTWLFIFISGFSMSLIATPKDSGQLCNAKKYLDFDV